MTFFNEQAELIRNILKDENIKVSIIDGIQGDERDIIIYSLVIKDPVAGKRQYVPMTAEGGQINMDIAAGRVNVAFSRAKLQVHAVTSLAPELWPDGIWVKKYLEYIEKNGIVTRRHSKAEQHFDSNFEDQVYSYLSKKLDANDYALETQTESLGFKIDMTVHHNGKKLAIECDGPTHFEDEGGQVYVKSDWERQGALEGAGWNFYRISYFDWVSDQTGEEKALTDFISEYFDDNQKVSKTSVVKELESETVEPEDAPKEMYVTDFSDEQVDNVNPVNASPTPKVSKSKASSNKGFSVGSREVNQDAFGDYLKARVSNNITIRYQSTRAGSAKYWRTLSLIELSDTYFSAFDPYSGINKTFRRDRVVDFK